MSEFLYKLLLNNDPGIGWLPKFFGIEVSADGVFSAVHSLVPLGLLTLLLAFTGYALGSLNFAVVVSRLFYHDDVRNYGSHNAGATNMKRTYGFKAAGMTLGGDILKGVVAVLIPRLLISTSAAFLAGLCCMIGHCFPMYFKFRGGKGVATAGAVIVTLNPLVGALVLLIFILVVLGTRYVSLGSIMAALFFPILLDRISNLILHTSPTALMIICALLMMVLVVVGHHANIKRLLAGKESKLSFKRGGSKNHESGEESPKSLHQIDDEEESDKK